MIITIQNCSASNFYIRTISWSISLKGVWKISTSKLWERIVKVLKEKLKFVENDQSLAYYFF